MHKPHERLGVPASESHIAMGLVVAAVAMGLMLWGIIWQANIIVYQKEVIRSLFSSHFGG